MHMQPKTVLAAAAVPRQPSTASGRKAPETLGPCCTAEARAHDRHKFNPNYTIVTVHGCSCSRHIVHHAMPISNWMLHKHRPFQEPTKGSLGKATPNRNKNDQPNQPLQKQPSDAQEASLMRMQRKIVLAAGGTMTDC